MNSAGLIHAAPSHEGWRIYALTLLGMSILAALDIAGMLFAKEWATRHHPLFFAAGLASFLILFVVYARILKVADLSVVTIGWIVLLQVGLVALDRFHYGVTLSPQKWAAIAIILALQAYLVLGVTEASPAPTRTPATQVTEPSIRGSGVCSGSADLLGDER